MHILQITADDFFSTDSGGPLYFRSIVDELLIQGNLALTIVLLVKAENIVMKEYKGCDIYECGELNDEELSALLKGIGPDVIHAHPFVHKGQICRIGHSLGIPVVVTAHDGGIVCPAETLLNCKDEICQIEMSHENCLRCCLRKIRTGLYWYPFIRLIPKSLHLRLGNWLQKKPFILFITPISNIALQIESKQHDWQEIKQYCTRMIAPSVVMKESMMHRGLKDELIQVIPHGVPLPNNKVQFPSTKDGFRFFYFGRICYTKGLHILLKAFHGLNNSKTELHIIGKAPNKTELRYEMKLRHKYRKDKRIFWHEKVAPEEVYNSIKDFHISVTSSFLESFGLTIAESLAMGKPVLATRCGGAEMQIEDGINGWLVPTNNAEDLRRKMEEIISMPEEQLAQMARKKKVMSIEEHCNELIKLYNTVYEKHNLSK